ncbi:MAG: FN3 associated domain-containing protein, partial [Clostridia bacterium]
FELVSVPPGLPIRYSTNGSDPRQGGSSYDGPFPIPAGARLVLAVSEYKGIQSQTASFPVSSGADGGGPWKIDPSRPLVWKTHKRFANKPAIEAFQILNRIREAGASADNVTITTYSAETGEELNYTLPEGIRKTGDDLVAMWEQLNSMLQRPNATLTVLQIYFDQGQALIDWQNKDRLSIDQAEVRQ